MQLLHIIHRRVVQPWLRADFDHQLRARLGMGLIIFFLALSSIVQFSKDWREFDPNQLGNDGITVYEKRFDRLRGVLPPRGVIGYVSDSDQYNIEYFLAQYTLAPLTLDPKQSHDLVVGNFANKTSNPKTWNGTNLELRLDLGNGVKLFYSR